MQIKIDFTFYDKSFNCDSDPTNPFSLELVKINFDEDKFRKSIDRLIKNKLAYNGNNYYIHYIQNKNKIYFDIDIDFYEKYVKKINEVDNFINNLIFQIIEYIEFIFDQKIVFNYLINVSIFWDYISAHFYNVYEYTKTKNIRTLKLSLSCGEVDGKLKKYNVFLKEQEKCK